MRIGVDYYPEHWDRQLWEKDAQLMKEIGVKVVRLAEFAWCKLEPIEGQYDFKWLDDVIEIFSVRNIEIVLGTPTNTPPLWLYEKYPDAIQVNESGERQFIGIRGHRCYNSSSMRKYTKAIVEAMTERYANNKAVIGWQIDNELDATHCCCDNCTEKFRGWLKNKYSTLENINKEYGNVVWSGEYSAWSQVTAPLGGSPFLNPSYLLDYNRFASDSMVEYIDFQREIIRKNCPSQFITTNTWFTGNLPNFYDAFENLDFVSYDNYPTTNEITDEEELHSHAFHCDLMRGIKKKNFWIMEQLSGTPGCWMPMQRTPKPGMIKGYSFQAIGRGAETVVHFRWRNAIIGAEMFWHGILDHSNVKGRRFYEFAELCREVNKINEEIPDYKINNEVAILYSSDQDFAFKIQPQVEGLYYLQQLKAFHNALIRLGVGTDIINWSESLNKYKVVIAPTLYLTDDNVTTELYRFVEAGGTLILTNRTGVKNMNNVCLMEQMPSNLKECAGVVVKEYDPIGHSIHTIKDEAGKVYQCKQWCDILEPTTAKVIATYNDDFYIDEAAVTVNKYKKGNVYYLGTVFNSDYYIELLSKILDEKELPYYKKLPYGLELSVLENENGKYLMVFNNSNEIKCFEGKHEGKSIIRNELDGKSFTLEPYGIEVLQLVE
ncbi:beta-galactosidase [Clostridium cellulovorans]|uniref:Beta-galactosidase BgaA n=1 Tax=Clostridium cellulovorans (strain ATCC 35296 / DSM 3052 / OCM 3 / 743B) TaxID=573061 RepID=BGAL_CLOC7|nr:beta-galactosidase [Clostridium cellulovorans]D9SM34.1 RecName: Full=Beta-galactosidase BgaA; Short=Beta-gal; AltName: Full=Alpha-L-arabinopyranosidase [Clostridium cellulovorans 743B]AAN05452.1 beta-galactosidase/alpha-L-arabinopyranosidase BgaA [Clostridium cellulovorans]ADL51765.1 Beta-galactosidase [Clostridium cellulovorans 743B]